MRIIPFSAERPDQESSSSRDSQHEYEVWRRWEDCLWFQDMMETEYSAMARQKRTRLSRGKGVRKEGMYLNAEHAASFESLPPGPEAQSIAKDIHEVIPKLTKKATIFRASQATIDLRAKEFRDMITALFEEDVPTLIKELRDQRLIRDFFGIWRRDQDLNRKFIGNTSDTRRNSVTSSVFSAYFSSSPNLSGQSPESFPEYPPHPPLPSNVPSSPLSVGSRRSTVPPSPLSGASRQSIFPSSPLSIASRQSHIELGSGLDHTASSSTLDNPLLLQPPLSAPAVVHSKSNSSLKLSESEDDAKSVGSKIAPRSFRWSTGSSKSSDSGQDFPVYLSDGQRHDQPSLQSLPEDQELNSDLSAMSVGPTDTVRPIVVGRRPRINSCPDRGHRNGLIFTVPPPEPVAVNSDSIATLDVADSGTSASTPSKTASFSQYDAFPHSRPVSTAFSTFSDLSQKSPRRASVLSESSIAHRDSYPNADDLQFDLTSLDPLLETTSTEGNTESQRPSHEHTNIRASISTLGSLFSDYSLDSVLGPLHPSESEPSLRRSLSVGSRRRVSVSSTSPSAGDVWNEQEDLIDTFFYGACLVCFL